MLYMQLGRFAVNIITTWEFPGFSTSYVLYCKLELRMKKNLCKPRVGNKELCGQLGN